ncbi:hypothetical protein H4R20_002305 [Coemansia guatemalensis]|uniref:Nudix hydrolase domain-containing protein n=1 Tax=Coemansia guatemalensis TaxID=2761395 RepID=A0A9W8HXW3_9FUNG|nr:hypothetical protein H4R20_002305 [Coemansia guatemalensis]
MGMQPARDNNDGRVWQAHGTAPPISALDADGIGLLRRRLTNALARGTPWHMRFRWKDDAAAAAVLMILCTVNGRVSLMFEERSNRLNSHGGEVCFAGGKADESDRSLEHTAMRETFEEIGLPEESITMVGKLPPAPNKGGTLRVHAFVGVVEQPLDVGALSVNRDEVHRVFTLPLAHFYDPSKRELVAFRKGDIRIPHYGTDKRGLRVWGLTAFLLNEFLSRIGSPENDTAPPSL